MHLRKATVGNVTIADTHPIHAGPKSGGIPGVCCREDAEPSDG